MNRNKDIIIFLIIAMLIIGGVWFARSKFTPISNIPTGAKLQVTTSFYPLYFFATQIGGDRADIVNIIPTGVEPHDYEPSAQDIIKMKNSSLLVLNGGGLEVWRDKILQTLNSGDTLVVTVGDGVIDPKTADPHIWLSPSLAKNIVEKIARGFEETDSVNRGYYQANAQALTQKLSDLDTFYMNGLISCARTTFVTAHAAFGYLASEYQLTQIPIAGLSPDAEPSPKQLAVIVEFARKNSIKFIFFESLVSPKLSETIAREVGAATLVLNPVEGLTPEEINQGDDYFSVMEKNLLNLKIALGCNK